MNRQLRQTDRRFIKSHLPQDATPYFDEVHYIIVGRDARDVFISMVHITTTWLPTSSR